MHVLEDQDDRLELAQQVKQLEHRFENLAVRGGRERERERRCRSPHGLGGTRQ